MKQDAIKPIGKRLEMGVRPSRHQFAQPGDECASAGFRVAFSGNPSGLSRVGVGESQRLFQLDDAFPCVRLHRHDRDAEFFGKFHRVEPQAGALGDVDHVEGDHAGQAEFDDLKRELQVALEIRGIQHADDEIRFRLAGEQAVERVERDFFIRRIRAQRVAAG